MGDSYSAGNGAGHYYGAAGCRRSSHNYGREFQRIVEAAPYRQRAFVQTVACSGDVTRAFAHRTSGRPPQLAAVDRGYDLIFLTIGGNDLKFAKIVQYCLIAKTRDGANCGPLLDHAAKLLEDGTLADRLRKLLAAVQAKADPTATIVLLGYPYLEADPGYTLRSGHFGHTFMHVGKRLRHVEDLGDNVQRNVVAGLNRASAAKIVFVSTKALFAGPPHHELYAKRNNRHRWFVQPFVDAGLFSRDLWYHPNPTGWKQEARLLARDPRVPKRDPAPRQRPPAIDEFALPGGSSSYPTGIVAGPDGNIWIAEDGIGSGGTKIARITTAGGLTEFAAPAGSYPAQLAFGADGNVWFAEGPGNTGDGIGRMTPSGGITEFFTPRQFTSPLGMTAGPDGNVWFSEAQVDNGNRIAMITPDGEITEYELPSFSAYVEYLTSGPDGAIWFTESDANQIGRITVDGDITEYPLPTSNAQPGAIAPGPDGNLWFTEQEGNKIGRITPDGQITEFALPAEKSHPKGITAGPDGAMWFTEWGPAANKIGRITTAGVITAEHPLPTPNASPEQVVTGPDGNLWFTEWSAGKVGRLRLSG
ncbi:MAG TPA: GDSL-type esterase/lipase family protein [Conexibacter sp.]|nr:GDSL-type esterase/lipase family protein [Conexibacter sp.]